MKNENLVDRMIRAVLGVALIAVALSGRSVWGWVGVVPLLTAIVGFCPLYKMFGISTHKA